MSIGIQLGGMSFYAYHGVSAQERTVGNYFLVDLKISIPVEAALASDSLDDTINYALLYEVVKKEMQIPSNLLEHVAGRILIALKKHFPQITSVDLVLKKLNPPLGGDVQNASVILSESYNSSEKNL